MNQPLLGWAHPRPTSVLHQGEILPTEMHHLSTACQVSRGTPWVVLCHQLPCIPSSRDGTFGAICLRQGFCELKMMQLVSMWNVVS